MKKRIYEILFVILLLIGVAVCTICDIAISGAYTWSLVPVSAIVFAWVALLPIKRYGKTAPRVCVETVVPTSCLLR